ncbi:MAG: pyridoxamine 5'-phosphate oxidase family protein [Gammaproteobacteria bacterium]|jgi:hypothetical protein|nr:pyridoxamine 5'-phosphate oxidase family protein [Gammaproteobacteria bacterium]
MGDRFEKLSEKHIDFISRQHMFFVGTAGTEGFVNVSPKGMDTFRVINDTNVAWLNLTGSGNETAAHVLESDRMTIMFCSFDKHPIILRLYGNASVTHPRDQKWDELIRLFPEYPGARQIFELNLELVLASCGYAVPYYELKGERPTLGKWADSKGRDGIEEYWQERNTESLNKKPTGIEDDA